MGPAATPWGTRALLPGLTAAAALLTGVSHERAAAAIGATLARTGASGSTLEAAIALLRGGAA